MGDACVRYDDPREHEVVWRGDELSGVEESECGTYRYRLWRRWSSDPVPSVILLRPSMETNAFEINDDEHQQIIDFFKKEGCGGVNFLYLFGAMVDHFDQLKLFDDPVGYWCDRAIITNCHAAAYVVYAWGALGAYLDRSSVVSWAIYRHPTIVSDSYSFGLTRLRKQSEGVYEALRGQSEEGGYRIFAITDRRINRVEGCTVAIRSPFNEELRIVNYIDTGATQ